VGNKYLNELNGIKAKEIKNLYRIRWVKPKNEIKTTKGKRKIDN
jgi:hypothetical protein